MCIYSEDWGFAWTELSFVPLVLILGFAHKVDISKTFKDISPKLCLEFVQHPARQLDMCKIFLEVFPHIN